MYGWEYRGFYYLETVIDNLIWCPPSSFEYHLLLDKPKRAQRQQQLGGLNHYNIQKETQVSLV